MPKRTALKRGVKHTIVKPDLQPGRRAHTKTKSDNLPDREIHTGLVVDASIVNLLPEELQHVLNESTFSQAIVAFLHCGIVDGGYSVNRIIACIDVKSKYIFLCREENRENIVARGYWKNGSTIILDITHKSKHYELVLNGSNERPMVIKQHIRQGKYGNSISFETKIHLPCQPYIYREKSGIDISK